MLSKLDRARLWVQFKLQSFIPWLCYLCMAPVDDFSQWVWHRREDYIYFACDDGFELWLDPNYGFQAEMRERREREESLK